MVFKNSAVFQVLRIPPRFSYPHVDSPSKTYSAAVNIRWARVVVYLIGGFSVTTNVANVLPFSGLRNVAVENVVEIWWRATAQNGGFNRRAINARDG